MVRIVLLILLLCQSASAQYFWWHKTASTAGDTSDANFIRPSDWNAGMTSMPESSSYWAVEFCGGTTTSNSIGETNISSTATNGTVHYTAGLVDHPCICSLNVPATANSFVTVWTSTSATINHFLGTEFYDVTIILRINHDTTDNVYVVRAGLSNGGNGNTQPTVGAFFERTATDNEWFGVLRNGGSATRITTGAAVSSGWHKLRFKKYDYPTDSVGFSVNGGTEVRIASNAPTSAIKPFVQMTNSATAAQKSLLIDYFGAYIYPFSR